MRTLVSELAEVWGIDPNAARRQLYDNLADLYAATVGKAP
jgi:hypothetical protein